MSLDKKNSRQRTTLRVENLEDRSVPAWLGMPPSVVSPSPFLSVSLNSAGDASGNAAITSNEVDYYRFSGPAGTYTFRAFTPNSNLDTVIGIFNSNGVRVAFNDDFGGSTDSQVTVNLAAGTYFLGVTNYTGTPGGTYTWSVNGPNLPPVSPPPVSPPPVSPPPAGQNGFQITLRMTGLTQSQRNIFNQAAARWSQAIIGDIPNATFQGTPVDDLLIDASARPIDGPNGVLGRAGPDAFRSGTLLPIHGIMEFDTADLAVLESNGQLFSVVVHEMAHVLGFGTIWQQRGLIQGAGTSNSRYVGQNGIAQYRALSGTNATSVPLETNGGPGTRDSHWRESVFGRELMTGFLNSGFNPLSRLTIGSMADLGYQVNLNAADPYTLSGNLVTNSFGTTGGSGGNLMNMLGFAIESETPRDAAVLNVNTPGRSNSDRIDLGMIDVRPTRTSPTSVTVLGEEPAAEIDFWPEERQGIYVG